MKKKLFALQALGTAATLATAWLLLLVPDSTLGFLLLSLLLMYTALFFLSFTLAAVGRALVERRSEAGWGDLLRNGRRGWWRAAAVLLLAAGLLFAVYRLGWLRLPAGLLISLLALLAIPATVGGTGPAVSGIPRLLAYAALAVGLGFAAWKIISTPAEMSRPWMEAGYLGLRMLASFLVANLACVLLLAAGASGLKSAAADGA